MNFNIPALLQAAFGIMPQALSLPAPQAPSPGSFTVATQGHVLEYDVTVLGTPWLEPMSMAESTDWDGNVFPGMQLPPTTMVDVSRKRTIVETAVAGRDGTVKELVSAQDYLLRFRGLLINDKSQDPPYAQIHEFKSMALFKGAISVEGRLFRALGIDALVVGDFAIRQIQGTPNAVAFDFSATSENSEEFAIMNGL